MEDDAMTRVGDVAGQGEPGRRSRRVCTLALCVGVLLGGCVSTQPALPPAPELQLVDAGTLQVPPDCDPESGAVYRTAFVVRPDGRVESVASESGEGCVQQALREWVSTFRYRPVDEPTAAVLDWMSVTAARGG
jgi:hypothetical protein